MSNNHKYNSDLKKFEEEADEVIRKPETKKSLPSSTSIKNSESLVKSANKIGPTDIDFSKYTKMYELNADGLKLYGQYKKEKLLRTLKWSFVGTGLGYTMAMMAGIVLRRWDKNKREYFQAFVLLGTMSVTTWIGFKISDVEFAKRTNVLIDSYGKEIN